MNLKRKAYQQLLSWKNRAGHLPLIVEGLRQVGKSYIVDKFARENYENVIVFDFRYNEVTRSFFQGNLTVDEILKRAYPYFPSSNFVPHKTIIVMEEIGDCPRARTSLKAFESDGRFDVIATGSLLGVANYRKRKKEALPTGSEEFLKMTSLDFEEFLWAIGASQDFIDRLKDSAESFAPLPEPYIEYGKVAMRSYLLVGGMPDAVIAFLESDGDPLAAREVHRRLLRDYEADFGRYVDDGGEERYDMILKGRISAVWKSIPMQLSRENKNSKFRYKDVGGRGRREDFELPLDWLEEAGLIIKCHNTSAPEPPLKSNALQDEFKVYVSDPGLLCATYEETLASLALDGLLGARKGALTENLIATMLNKAGLDCFYYGSALEHKEIDFLLEDAFGILLLEAKSTNGGMAASKALMEGKSPYKRYRCFKIIENDFGKGAFYQSLPHFAFPFFLEKVMSRPSKRILFPEV